MNGESPFPKWSFERQISLGHVLTLVGLLVSLTILFVSGGRAYGALAGKIDAVDAKLERRYEALDKRIDENDARDVRGHITVREYENLIDAIEDVRQEIRRLREAE